MPFPSRLPRFLAILTILACTAPAHPVTNAASTTGRLPTPLNATFTVGSQVFKLIDDSRTDPFNSTEKRAVAITAYYPSAGQGGGTSPDGADFAPYMPTAMAGLLDRALGIPSGALESVLTDTCLGAPAVSSDQRNLIVMSTGLGLCRYISCLSYLLSDLHYLGASRLVYQTYTIALAAHGYVVIGINHPYDAGIVEYPDGRLVFAAPLNLSDPTVIPSIVWVRTKDVQFVLDQVCNNADLTLGIPVDCGVQKVGMFGHSLGGATAADMTIIDQRVAGGGNLDGTFFPIQSRPDVSPDTPFLVIAAEGHNATIDPTYGDWFKTPTANSAKRLMATVKGTKHLTFTDFPVLLDVFEVPRSDLLADEAAELGTIDGLRISEILQVVLNAWFDLILKGDTTAVEDLLKHGSEKYPEVGLAQGQGTA
ncbi:hypothetical protein FRB95_010857 [Tulasnella sp. JGI-2019a]|nr:hypothetical protein FRB95_010857 [Tulasnella sp. JGI-2019a]